MRHLLLTLCLLLGTLAMAQDKDDNNPKRSPEERAKHRTESMTKDLGLDAEQVARVYDINLRFARSASEASELKDEKARKERKQALKQERDTAYKAVLTAEQFTKLLQQRENKDNKGKKKGGEGQPEKKPHNE